MTNIGITENWVWVLIGLSSVDLLLNIKNPAPVMIAVNPVTHALIVEIG